MRLRSKTVLALASWTWCLATVLLMTPLAHAADFGNRGGPAPANVDAITKVLRQDAYDMELLISFGTSKGGSAGHLALAIRDDAASDDRVYSANFYADRSRQHQKDFYVDDLMVGVPKSEYLFGTTSSLGDKASFGLDFGEVYKRSVIGVRVYGVPSAEKQSLEAFFKRINDDYHRQARDTEYHDGEVKYDYLRLNCAKTIGAGFRFGAGYQDLEVTSAPILSRRRLVAAANANVPTEMAMKLLEAWNTRGYGLDVVMYKKFPAQVGWTRTRRWRSRTCRTAFLRSCRATFAGSATRTSTTSTRCTCFTTLPGTACGSMTRPSCSRSRGARARWPTRRLRHWPGGMPWRTAKTTFVVCRCSQGAPESKSPPATRARTTRPSRTRSEPA